MELSVNTVTPFFNIVVLYSYSFYYKEKENILFKILRLSLNKTFYPTDLTRLIDLFSFLSIFINLLFLLNFKIKNN